MAIQAQVRPLTVDDFWELARLPENQHKRLELVNGAIKEVAPSSTQNSIIGTWFSTYLNMHMLENPVGYVTSADGGYTMKNGNVRQPDAAYISRARYPEPGDKVFPVAPDIAVEVISPSESSKDVREKVREYLESGTTLVWAAYDETRSVDVYRLNPDGSIHLRTVAGDAALSGEDVLPGLSIVVSKLFPE